MNKETLDRQYDLTNLLSIWYHGEIGGIPLAAISATNIFVSARMTSRPGLAKIMLADNIPKKNFPSKVPSAFHTYSHPRQ
jgi:hypothetical protein